MSFTFVPKPSQMSGIARRISNGLKKILKNGFSSKSPYLAIKGWSKHYAGAQSPAIRPGPADHLVL